MIYLLIAVFFLFASILFLSFIYANFLLHCNYYCVNICHSHVSNIYIGKVNIYIFIAYFCICLPPQYCFVLFMLPLCFIFIIILLQYFCHVYRQKFTKHHNTVASTTSVGRFKNIGCLFYVLFRLCYFILFII